MNVNVTVELSGDDGRLEDRSSTRMRLRDDPQTGRADSSHWYSRTPSSSGSSSSFYFC